MHAHLRRTLNNKYQYSMYTAQDKLYKATAQSEQLVLTSPRSVFPLHSQHPGWCSHGVGADQLQSESDVQGTYPSAKHSSPGECVLHSWHVGPFELHECPTNLLQ